MDQHAGYRKRAKIEASTKNNIVKASNLTRAKAPLTSDTSAVTTTSTPAPEASSVAAQEADDHHLPPRGPSASGRELGFESSDHQEEGNMEKKRDREKKRRSEITNAVERLSQTIAKIEQPRGRVDTTAWNIVAEYARSSPSSSLFPHPTASPVAVAAISIAPTTSASAGDADNKKSSSNTKQPSLSSTTTSSCASSSSFNRQQQQNRTHVISNACDLIEKLQAENLQLKEQLRLFVRGSGADGSNLSIGDNSSNTNIAGAMSNLLAHPTTNNNLDNAPSAGAATTVSSIIAPSSHPQSKQVVHFPQQQQTSSSSHVPILPLNDSRGSAMFRNRLPPPFNQQQGEEILHLRQLQQIQQDSQLASPALHQHQQPLLMQHQFSQSGNSGRGLQGMQTVLGGGGGALRAQLPPNPSGDLLNMVLGAGGRGGQMPNQQHPMNNMAHPESNLLLTQLDQQYQQDLSLQQYLLVRSLHSQRDAHQNTNSNATTLGENNLFRGGGGFHHRTEALVL